MGANVKNSEKKETSKAKIAFPKTSLVHLIQSANYKVFLKWRKRKASSMIAPLDSIHILLQAPGEN